MGEGEGEGEVQPASPALGGLHGADVRRLGDLIRRDHNRIRNVVLALCGSQVDVDGVVAEAVARAVERLSAGREIHDLRAWVTATAVNLGRSEMRRHLVRRRYAPLLGASTSSEGAMETAALRLDVQEAFRQLPRRQAEVVALYYGLDLSVSDIAASLGRTEGAVKSSLFKARKNLEAKLGRPDGGERHEPD